MRTKAATIAVLAVGSIATARGDDADNRIRLEAMPREQRVHLSKTLDEYDVLPGPDRAAIRNLDAALARLDPDVQARYRALLRHYHVWVNGLDDAQKEQLAKAPSLEAKLALVTKWRKVEREADTRAKRNMIFGVQPGELGILPPWEMADALRIWLKLDESERKEVEKHEKVRDRLLRLWTYARTKNALRRPFPPRAEESLVTRLQEDELIQSAFRNWISKREKKAESETPKPEGAKKAELPKVGNPLQDPLHHLAESLYFSQHPPEPVMPEHLEQFDAQIPSWLRATLDPLPPDDARRRLTILYRQIYRPGQEITLPPKPDPAAAKAKPAPAAKPAATTPGVPAPF